ncbi:MAG: RNA polymerase sigma factor [Ahrensia sp.]
MRWFKPGSQETVRRGLVDLYPRLNRYCLAVTADTHAAEDLAHAVCIRALERAHQFKPDTRLDSWIFTIAQRLWIDELRKRAVRNTGHMANVDDIELQDHAPDPETNAINADMMRAMMTLPEAQRVATLLVYGEGYSYKDAADILDIPIGTVMSRLAAARTKMVDMFQTHAKAG